MSLEIRGLHKRFAVGGAPVLNGVSYDVPSGSLSCLLGASGAGKSTLLHIIAGLACADAGDVAVDGVSLHGVAAHRRPLTMVRQQPHLFEHLNALDNVAFGLRVRRVNRRRRRAEAGTYLDLVGVGALAERFPRQLSGGEAHRVALARALAIKPRVLLADEPFAGVDGPVRRELQELIGTLQRELSVTTVLVTHDLQEALTMADRLVVLADGQVCGHGEPRTLYDRPCSEQAARLLGVMNRWDTVVERGAIRLGEQCFTVCPSNARGGIDSRRAARWAIRPERVRLAGRTGGGDPSGSGAGANIFAGTVTAVRYLGANLEATIRRGSHEVVALASPDGPVQVGQPCCVELPVEHLFEIAALG